jgi:hypothetical protein
MMPAAAASSRGAKRGVARESSRRDVRAGQAVAAMQLLGRWQRVCGGHLSFTNGCACGVGASVDLGDLDDLIIDYLKRKFEQAPHVAGFIADHDVPGGLKSLLRALATEADLLSADEARTLIVAIEASVASIEEQHRT